RIDRLPHFRTDSGAQLLSQHRPRQSFGLRLLRYSDSHMIRELPQLDGWRKQVGIRITPCWRKLGNRPRGRQEHFVRYASRLYSDGAEPNTRLDISVIGLIDPEWPTIPHNWWKGTAGANDGAAFCPGEELFGRCLASFGRVGERKDHRALHMRRH